MWGCAGLGRGDGGMALYCRAGEVRSTGSFGSSREGRWACRMLLFKKQCQGWMAVSPHRRAGTSSVSRSDVPGLGASGCWQHPSSLPEGCAPRAASTFPWTE